jgi:hypothetical protein
VARPQDANEVFTCLWAPSRYGRRVSEQTRPGVAADHRSIIPWIPGVPWWAAVVIAVTGCAVGFAFDAGSGKDLTTVFSGLYVAGCVAAVLAVRQSGIFTAVIQPPLILFGAVPGSYWLFHGAKYTGIKDLLINCGYPLIERFPLMLFTAAGVLLVGLVRWYLGIAARPRATAAAEATEVAGADAVSEGGRLGLATRLMSMLKRASTGDGAADKAAKSRARRVHAVERSARSASADRGRTGRSPAASRARRPRPLLDARNAVEDGPDPTRHRGRPTRPRDSDAAEPPRRGRLPRDPDLHGRPPREVRRDPHARGARPTGRSGRFDPYEPVEPFEPAPPRRRSMANGATATHHPISQVRYRTSNGVDGSRNEPTPRARRPGASAADSWDLDV